MQLTSWKLGDITLRCCDCMKKKVGLDFTDREEVNLARCRFAFSFQYRQHTLPYSQIVISLSDVTTAPERTPE